MYSYEKRIIHFEVYPSGTLISGSDFISWHIIGVELINRNIDGLSLEELIEEKKIITEEVIDLFRKYDEADLPLFTILPHAAMQRRLQDYLNRFNQFYEERFMKDGLVWIPVNERCIELFNEGNGKFSTLSRDYALMFKKMCNELNITKYSYLN